MDNDLEERIEYANKHMKSHPSIDMYQVHSRQLDTLTKSRMAIESKMSTEKMRLSLTQQVAGFIPIIPDWGHGRKDITINSANGTIKKAKERIEEYERMLASISVDFFHLLERRVAWMKHYTTHKNGR